MTDMPAEALALSVREDEPKEHLSTAFWWYSGRTSDLLPSYGEPRRDVALRQFWYATHNTILQGAISGLVKRIVATPWEISGGPRLSRRFQDILQDAEFGKGYDSLLTKVLTDYYTQDGGGVIEVIGRGDKESPLRGPVAGLAHLDRHRCAFTGSTEHPVAYFPRRGGVIYLHHTRVHRFVDMESPDEELFGNGFCALSRAIGITNAQILMGRYQNEKLGNEPPAGLIVFSNVTPQSAQDIRERYSADRQREGTNTYAPLQFVEGTDPEAPVKVEFVPFAQLPDHFDEQKFTEIHVNKVALALNDDPQEIWPLTGQAGQGTGTQTRMLDAKGKAKALGSALAMFKRFFNLRVLPEELKYIQKYRDQEHDKQVAETAQVWTGVSTQLLASGQLDVKMANRLLANQVEAFANVLLDEAGNVRLPDDDKVPEDQTIVTDDTVPEQPDAEGDPIVVEDDTDAVAVAKMFDGWTWYTDGIEKSFNKDFMNTQAEFIRNLTDLFKGAADGDLTRRRAGTVLRAQLARLGAQGMKDGLADGGVEVDALDADDQKIVAKWLAEQSGYVTNALNKVYDGATINPEDKAIMWARKSLQAIYMEGVASADKNGLYKFGGPDGEESCSTCTVLKNQVHRMKDWVKRRLRPGVDTENFECGGWRCEHYLEKTEGRAHGRWPVSKALESDLPRAA